MRDYYGLWSERSWIGSFHRLSATIPARRLCRLLRLQPELGDRLLAHDELLDLAGDGHRELGHELDVARDLVVGDLALAELADLLGRRRSGRRAA